LDEGMTNPTPDPLSLPTVPEVLDKLNSLGSPDQIALFFQQEGIQAEPGRSETCAVAEYIRQETQVSKVIVTPTSVSMLVDKFLPPLAATPWDTESFHFKDEVDYPTPPTVQEFINKFDAGEYPQLLSLTGRYILSRTKSFTNHPSFSITFEFESTLLDTLKRMLKD
jgi:hypothetical protein